MGEEVALLMVSPDKHHHQPLSSSSGPLGHRCEDPSKPAIAEIAVTKLVIP